MGFFFSYNETVEKKRDLSLSRPHFVYQRSRLKNNNNNNNNEKKKKKKKPRSVLFLPLHSVFLDDTALKTNLKSVPLVGILFGNNDRDLVLKTHLFFRRETGEIVILISLVLLVLLLK